MTESSHPEFRIIPFETNMLERLAAVFQEGWGTAAAYAERFTDDEARRIVSGLPDIWIAMAGDEIAGFTAGIAVCDSDEVFHRSICKSADDAYYIDSVVVMPDYRERGLGRRLLELLLESATRRGFREFLLRTTLHESNDAPSLYKSLGFEVLTDRRGLPVVRVVEQDRLDGRSRNDARVYLSCTRTDPQPEGDIAREHQEFARAVRKGLLKPSGKSLPHRFIYDRTGSDLFQQICELPEYYQARCETEVLQQRSDDIAQACTGRVGIVELGSGASTKTRIVLEALLRRGLAVTYRPIDISVEALEASAAALRLEYPALTVETLPGDYESGLQGFAPASYDTVLALWLGTSIGNLEPWQAEALLRQVKEACGPGGLVVLGVDLKKDKALLEKAYDDDQGVTAQFNLNLLARINRELGGRFDLSQFEHKALYDEEAGRIEMHLRSRVRQTVPIGSLGTAVEFEAGETIHTENSYKFTPEEIEALGARAELRLLHHWTDARSLYSVNLFRA